MKDIKSDGSVCNKTEQGVVLIDFFLMMTMLLDLSGVKVRAAHFWAIAQQESKVLALQIVEGIMFRLSMKGLNGGKEILFI